MKAIIMAGGEGTRLRPITCSMPKPAVPIKDKPVILHIIELLEKHGIYNIAVTLGYMPSHIKKIVEGAHSSGEIKSNVLFCTESEPLGTAGSVRNCIEECFGGECGDILIISGDAFTDINIREMAEFHKKQGRMATIAVKEVDTPTEFGIVLVNGSGMVTGFIEKPDWNEAVTNLVNTGIYIITDSLMELCPREGACDFAKDIFSKVPDISENIAAYHTDAYWCDIGDCEAYRSVNLRSGSFTGENCSISPEAEIKNSIICHGSSIEAGSIITNSVIMPNTSIGRACRITDSIICPDVKIGDACCAEECVIGESAGVGHSCIIKKGTKIWNGVDILPESVMHGIVREAGGTASSYSPENVLRLGKAFGTFIGRHASCLVCTDGSGSGSMAAACMQAALASVGAAVKILGNAALPVVRWICRSGVCDGAVYISDDGEFRIRFLNKFGDDLSKNERRKLKSIYALEDFAAVRREEIHPFENICNPEDYYISSLLDIFKCPHKNLNYIGKRFTKSRRYAAAAYITVKMFPDAPIFIAASESMAARKIAEKYDRYIITCGARSGDIMAEMEKFMHIDGVYAEYLMFFDDLAFDLALCCIDSFIDGELDSDAKRLICEPMYTSETHIDCRGCNRADIIRRLTVADIAGKSFEINDGVCIRDSEGEAHVSACEDRNAFRVYVESMSEEYAMELSSEIVKAIQNLLT